MRVYRYVSVFFIFSVAWGGQYLRSTLTEAGWAQRPVSQEEAMSRLGGEDLQPPLRRRFGLSVAVVVLVLIGSFSH